MNIPPRLVILTLDFFAGCVPDWITGARDMKGPMTGAVPVGDLAGELRAAVERADGRRLAVIPEGPYVGAFVQPD